MYLLITNSIVTVLHLLTGVTSLIHLALYYCFVIWVPFKLQITLECYIMFIFSKLTSFSMVLWLVQGKHGLQSFPLSITRRIVCHKISVWNVFGRFMAMALENAGLEKSFLARSSIQAAWLLLGISLLVPILIVWATGNLEQILGYAKMSFHKGHLKQAIDTLWL